MAPANVNRCTILQHRMRGNGMHSEPGTPVCQPQPGTAKLVRRCRRRAQFGANCFILLLKALLKARLLLDSVSSVRSMSSMVLCVLTDQSVYAFYAFYALGFFPFLAATTDSNLSVLGNKPPVAPGGSRELTYVTACRCHGIPFKVLQGPSTTENKPPRMERIERIVPVAVLRKENKTP